MIDPRDAFDLARVPGPIRFVRVAEVLDLLPLTHAPETVAAFGEAFRRGERFPPIAVLPLAGRLVLADGHKRFAAWRQAGGHEIAVEVWTPSRWLADQLRQVRDNARKNARILRLLADDRPEALRLLRATTGHWRRVATSLVQLATGRRPPGT